MTSTHSAPTQPTATRRQGWRVAVVTETYPPEVNGVAVTISRIVEGLRAQGHQVQLIRPRQPGDATRTTNDCLMRGLPIPRYPDLRMGLPATGELLRRWREARPDVVHLVTEGPLGWSALRAARRLGLPVVSDFRTNFHAYTEHYGLSWLRRPIVAYLRHLHNRTACTMVPTAALQQELAGMGFERLQVVARGVDAQRFHPGLRSGDLRREWGADDDTPVVLCVGRLAPEKNLDAVVAAWRAMAEVNPRTRLVLVGDGPDRPRLMALAPEAIFMGTQRGDALARCYASADVFAFASLTETFGNVVPEAMASGLAVLAYQHAAAGQLIEHRHNGVLAPAGDETTFLRLARTLASDPAWARHLGQQARETAQALDWQHILSGIEAQYLAAMSPSPQTSSALRPARAG